MSSTPFGEHLKREREMRGVSLEEISASTRISTRFLEAIERDQWDQLPGGVFNRGFIRSIARYLGLDEDDLVAEYSLGTKANGDLHTGAQQPAEMPRNWRPAALAIAALILLAAGGMFAYRRYRAIIAARLHKHTAEVAANASTAPAPSAPVAAAPLTLKIEAGKTADVKVVADGKTVFEGSVEPNDVKQFKAEDNFEITSSDSSAVLLELNGQTVRPIGTPGQPGNVTLTRKDLKTAAGGPD